MFTHFVVCETPILMPFRPLAPLAGDNEPIYYRFALSTHRYMLTTQCAVSHHIMYQYLTNIFSDALASLALIIVTD